MNKNQALGLKIANVFGFLVLAILIMIGYNSDNPFNGSNIYWLMIRFWTLATPKKWGFDLAYPMLVGFLIYIVCQFHQKARAVVEKDISLLFPLLCFSLAMYMPLYANENMTGAVICAFLALFFSFIIYGRIQVHASQHNPWHSKGKRKDKHLGPRTLYWFCFHLPFSIALGFCLYLFVLQIFVTQSYNHKFLNEQDATGGIVACGVIALLVGIAAKDVILPGTIAWWAFALSEGQFQGTDISNNANTVGYCLCGAIALGSVIRLLLRFNQGKGYQLVR